MNRQVFFAVTGGFDNHEQLVSKQAQLMADVNSPFAAFFSTLQTTGMMNNVTLFTESEFNRMGNSNTNMGTGHAWDNHHLVIGGAVKGGVTYGTFPRHELNGIDDAGGRGNWIPSASLDQYAATLGSWFGVSDAELLPIFPNLANFSPQKLGLV